MKQTKIAVTEEITKEIENFGIQMARFKNKEIPEEKFKRFRLQYGIYGQRQAGLQMVRVKIPSGLLNARKLRCLADISEKYTKGIGHVTTRQDIQFHYVDLDHATTIMTQLAEAGLTTREACGNTVRNVTACQHAGTCPTELFDVTPYGEKVAYHLLRNPITQDMPRKFKISFSGCQSECGLAAIHDIGFIAESREIAGETVYGFKVLVGGGLGSHPKLAMLYTEFLPIDEVLVTCEAILRIFDKHGDRRRKSKARMKFILEKWGLDLFKEKVSEELAALKKEGREYPALPRPVQKTPSQPLSMVQNGNGAQAADPEYARWMRTNVVPRPEKRCAVQIKLTLGDITVAQFRGLADVVDRYSPDGLRTTHQQNMLLHSIHRKDLPDLYRALCEIDLAEAGAERVVDVIACPGAETCQLALTSSMGLGGALVESFSKDLPEYEDLEGLRIRISGCPNSCGHHHIAGIGFHGVAKKVNGTLAPHYQLHLGGKVDAEASVIGSSNLKIPAKNIPSMVLEMVRIYREKHQEEENFNDFVERFGRKQFCEQLERFTSLPTPEAAPDAYLDWKEEKAFTLDDLGPGECSGTVIDMIEYALRMGRETVKKAALAVKNSEYPEAVKLMKEAILFESRALLYTYGIESPHEDETLKEFQHKLVEQGILSEDFEYFTVDLGVWTDFDMAPTSVSTHVERAAALIAECQAAYDRMDASMKLRKREPSEV
ncbi:MAG: nitrite/sulfite reductase [Nitrospira sp.]|nr:nitrite/sulfite reductase [Candidatus Manganitrophaceae bacterium]HIL34711.1 nitrite/sulfite reductase [Candidatus Manganitrophaceae bacterium]